MKKGAQQLVCANELYDQSGMFDARNLVQISTQNIHRRRTARKRSFWIRLWVKQRFDC
jgi:hypothetical protein